MAVDEGEVPPPLKSVVPGPLNWLHAPVPGVGVLPPNPPETSPHTLSVVGDTLAGEGVCTVSNALLGIAAQGPAPSGSLLNHVSVTVVPTWPMVGVNVVLALVADVNVPAAALHIPAPLVVALMETPAVPQVA